jgi:hypothetical protein
MWELLGAANELLDAPAVKIVLWLVGRRWLLAVVAGVGGWGVGGSSDIEA